MNQRGLTLIEILIAIVILSIGILGIGAMQMASTRGNFFSHYLTQACYVAQDRLEFLNHLPYDDALLTTGIHNDGNTTLSGIAFSRSYEVANNGDLKTITYTVAWNDGMNRQTAFSTIRSH